MRISPLAASRAFTVRSNNGKRNENYAAMGNMIRMRMMSDLAAPSVKVRSSYKVINTDINVY